MEIDKSMRKKIKDLAEELRDNNIPFIIMTSTKITLEILTEMRKTGIGTGSGLCAINGNGVEFTDMLSRAIIQFCNRTGASYEIALNTVNRVVRGTLGDENRDEERVKSEDIVRKGVEDFIQEMKKKFRDAGIDADIEAAVVSTDDFDSNEDMNGEEYS